MSVKIDLSLSVNYLVNTVLHFCIFRSICIASVASCCISSQASSLCNRWTDLYQNVNVEYLKSLFTHVGCWLSGVSGTFGFANVFARRLNHAGAIWQPGNRQSSEKGLTHFPRYVLVFEQAV